MRNIFSLVIVISLSLLSINTFSQIVVDPLASTYEYNDNKPYEMKLDASKNDHILFPFYVDQVIDSTGSEFIGYVKKGIFNVNRPVCLKGGTKKAIHRYIAEINTATGGYIPLHIVITKVNILEDMNAFNVKTSVFVSMKFYSLGTLLYSTTDHTNNTSIDGTKSHDNNIKKGVKNCLNSFKEYYESNKR